MPGLQILPDYWGGSLSACSTCGGGNDLSSFPRKVITTGGFGVPAGTEAGLRG